MTHHPGLLLAMLCLLHGTACSTPEPTPTPPATEPPLGVDPRIKADLEFFCQPLSEALMSTPDEDFTQAVFAHWTGTITSEEVLALIDTLTDPNTSDPIPPLQEALARAGIERCPVQDQLFEVTAPPAARGDVPRVATTDAEMSEALRRVVQMNIGDIQACYQEELRVMPDFDGRIKLGITIDARGAVSELSVQYSEDVSPRPEFTACLYNEVLTWTFPIPPSPPMKVVYPLKFES